MPAKRHKAVAATAAEEDRGPHADPVKIGDTRVDIDAFLTRDYGDIEEASEELPGLIEYINQEYQYAVEDKLNLRQEVKTRAAEIIRDIRQPGMWERLGFAGKLTEKGVEAAINLDEHYLTLTEKYHRMVGRCGRLANMMTILQVKLDLVRSVEATKRKLVPDVDGLPRRHRHADASEEEDGEHEET